LKKIEVTADKDIYLDACLFIGKELLLISDKKKAEEYFNKIITSVKNKDYNEILAKTFYYKKNFVEAEKVLKEIYLNDSKDISNISKLAICFYKNGKQKEAARAITEMKTLVKEFQFGELDYALAQYYAAINDEENSMNYLLKSVAQGKAFKNSSYQNDPHFLAYFNNREFQNILKFWN